MTRALREKLQALAERGVNGERDAAKAKLANLEAQYDFSVPVQKPTADLFFGNFEPSGRATFVCELGNDPEIANAAKWAIETACDIDCSYRNGNQLFAEATARTAQRLAKIADTITRGITELWTKLSANGVQPSDKNNFILGLYDGMMNDSRPIGQPLPSKVSPKLGKKKKRSITSATGLNIHPYSLALNLGRQIRFCVPIEEVTNQLEQKIKGEIAA